MSDNFKSLEQIKKVEPSPFLLKRINQRIKSISVNYLPSGLLWSMGLSYALLIVINIFAISYSLNEKISLPGQMIKQMHLAPENTLY